MHGQGAARLALLRRRQRLRRQQFCFPTEPQPAAHRGARSLAAWSRTFLAPTPDARNAAFLNGRALGLASPDLDDVGIIAQTLNLVLKYDLDEIGEALIVVHRGDGQHVEPFGREAQIELFALGHMVVRPSPLVCSVLEATPWEGVFKATSTRYKRGGALVGVRRIDSRDMAKRSVGESLHKPRLRNSTATSSVVGL